MIVVRSFLTADNTDALSATDLASIPRDGILIVHAISTQNDTLFTITGPGIEPVIRTRALPLRANAEYRRNEDVPYIIPVQQAGRYVLNVDVVTAATVQIEAIYLEAAEVAAGLLPLVA